MTALSDPGVEAHTTNPDRDGQYLLRTYRGNGPTIRTIAWRPDVSSTWEPEHLLFAVAAGELP